MDYGTIDNPVRTNADLLVNTPAGFPSDPRYGPVWWIGSSHFEALAPADALAVVTRATSLVIDPLVSDPFQVLTDITHGLPLPTPRWILDPMLLRPDDRFPGSATPSALRLSRPMFFREWVRSALWHGMGYFVAQFSSGQPIPGTMRVLNPLMVRSENGRWVIGEEPDRIMTDEDGAFSIGGRPYRVVALRNPLSPLRPDGTTVGVFARNPSVFGSAAQIEAYSRSSFRSGVPSGYLKHEQGQLTQEQADMLKKRWMEAHGGDGRSVAVLSATTSYTPIAWNPVDMGVSESKRLSVADIAFAFGMAPEVLGVSLGSASTYSNLGQWWRLHRDYCLSPWVDEIGATLTALIPGTAGVAVDLDAFERPDLKDRLANYEVALRTGLMTVEEIRHMEGWAATMGGDGNA